MQIIGLSATPLMHSEAFGNGPDSVRVEAMAKKVLSCMNLPHRPYVALWPTADLPELNHSTVSIPDSVPIVYSLWWFNLDRFPNCSKWFECHDVVSSLASVMLKCFHS